MAEVILFIFLAVWGINTLVWYAIVYMLSSFGEAVDEKEVEL